MTEARNYASLSSGLLARKGAAKPAMRPQGFGQFGAGLEDLGWNDMGAVVPVSQPAMGPGYAEELPEHVPSSISALTPSPRPGKAEAVPEPEPEPEPEPVPVPEVQAAPEPPEPPVVEQRRAIAENFGAEEEAEPGEAPHAAIPAAKAKAEVVKLPPRAKGAAKGRKSAFTLRLDPERHLRLRLACAVSGRSAQQIVTGALDAWLETIPEVETLAERAAGGQRSRAGEIR